MGLKDSTHNGGPGGASCRNRTIMGLKVGRLLRKAFGDSGRNRTIMGLKVVTQLVVLVITLMVAIEPLWD